MIAAEYTGDGSYAGILLTNYLDQVVTNHVPVVGVHAITTATNAPITISINKLLAGDSDADLDVLSVTAVGSALPAGASVDKTATTITYTPPADTAGAGSFEYTLDDGFGGVVTGLVTVTITDPSAGTGGVSPNATYAEVEGGEFVARFAGVPGRNYTVQTNDAPSGSGWVKQGTYQAPTNNAAGFGIGVFEVREPVDGTRYYRTVYPSY